MVSQYRDARFDNFYVTLSQSMKVFFSTFTVINFFFYYLRFNWKGGDSHVTTSDLRNFNDDLKDPCRFKWSRYVFRNDFFAFALFYKRRISLPAL